MNLAALANSVIQVVNPDKDIDFEASKTVVTCGCGLRYGQGGSVSQDSL